MSKGIFDKIKSFFKGNDDDNDFQISAPVAGQGHAAAPAQANTPAPAPGSNQLAAQAASSANESAFDEEVSETGDNLINKFESKYQSSYSIRLSSFHSMLAESKKHGPLKNSSSFNNVLKHIALVYRMMRTSFTGNKDKNAEIYATTVETLNNLISMCDVYINTHNPHTNAGQKRKDMVVDIKSIANGLLTPIQTARTEFESLTVESQTLNSFPSILNKPNGLIRTKNEQQNRLNEKRSLKDKLAQDINELKAQKAAFEGKKFEIPEHYYTTMGSYSATVLQYDSQISHIKIMQELCKKEIEHGGDNYAINVNFKNLNAYIQTKIAYDSIVKNIEEKNQQINDLDEDLNPFSQRRKDNAIWLKRVDLDLGNGEDSKRIFESNSQAISHFQDKSNPFSWESKEIVGSDIPLEAVQILDHNAQEMLSDKNSEGYKAFLNYTLSSTGFNTVLAGFEGSWSKPAKGEVNIDKYKFGDRIRALTSLIEQSSLPHDIWLQTGQKFQTLNSILDNVSASDLENMLLQIKNGAMTMDDATEKLQGNVGVAKIIPQFLSTTTYKGGGGMFNNSPVKLNIYAPAGAELLYAGEKGQYGYGEQEIILQRGGTYVIKRIYWGMDKTKSADPMTLFIDLELHNELGYKKSQQDKNEWNNNHAVPNNNHAVPNNNHAVPDQLLPRVGKR